MFTMLSELGKMRSFKSSNQENANNWPFIVIRAPAGLFTLQSEHFRLH